MKRKMPFLLIAIILIMSYGFLFFPGEARSAQQLRLQLVEGDTDRVHVLQLNL